MLWMFASPVFYASDLLPPAYRSWFALNPFAHYPQASRALLLHSGTLGLAAQALSLAIAVGVLVLGLAVFRRLNPHFEDFL